MSIEQFIMYIQNQGQLMGYPFIYFLQYNRISCVYR